MPIQHIFFCLFFVDQLKQEYFQQICFSANKWIHHDWEHCLRVLTKSSKGRSSGMEKGAVKSWDYICTQLVRKASLHRCSWAQNVYPAHQTSPWAIRGIVDRIMAYRTLPYGIHSASKQSWPQHWRLNCYRKSLS